MHLLRVVVCGSDASGKKTLAARLEQAHGHDRRRVLIVEGQDSQQSMHALASEAIASHLAIVVTDAQRELTFETRRQVHVLLALGLERVVIAVNKVDLVGYDQQVFAQTAHHCRDFAAQRAASRLECVPISALHGDNIEERSPNTGWYARPLLCDFLRPDENSRDQIRTDGTSAHQFEAAIVWAASQPMLQSRSYLMQAGHNLVSATVAPLKCRIDSHTLQPIPSKSLDWGDVGVCNLELAAPITFHPNQRRFALLDHPGGETVGVVLLHFALRRSENLRWQALDVTKGARAALMGQKPCVIWFTGLSGAGKSTIANLVEKRIHALGRHTYLLDGDNVRHGLNKDLGFTDADRVENIRRVAEVARLMVDAGLVVLVSFISPFRSERRMARALFGTEEFIEVFVDTPLDVAESRDPKGLYRKARLGILKNFTGVDSPYEVPEKAELRLDTTRLTAEGCAQEILSHLERTGVLR